MKTTAISLNSPENLIIGKCLVAQNFWQRFRGLMLKRELPGDCAMFFPGVTSIHTFFMCFSIDVIWIDNKNKIVDLKENLRPWRLAVGPGPGGVIETAAGTVKKLKLKLEQQIIFV